MKQLKFNIDSKIKQLFQYEETKNIFDTYLPGMRSRLESQKGVSSFSLRKVISYSGGAISESAIEKIDQALQNVIVYVDDTEITEYTKQQPLTTASAEMKAEGMYTSIRPGKVWRDTEGKRIQTHGGALYYEDGIYYWYGENKDRTDGNCTVWTWGIRVYRSKDLYNWEDLGLMIEPILDNPNSGLYSEKHVDRPHILKCEKTGKYVCWIKQSGEEACFLILEAECFTGPYQIVKENYRPFDWEVGDFDLIKTEDKKAYLFMDVNHNGIYGFELSDDYQKAEKEISRQYENLHPPFCREAVALFERNKKKYMLTSGMTGYIPNKSDAAYSDSWTEPFQSIGNPHPEDESHSSFNSQISQVFQVPGKKDLYIAIADRWVPDYPIDKRRADLIMRSVASHYEPEKYPMTEEEKREIMDRPMLEDVNTSKADYVWLPLRFEDEKVYIDWSDEWRIEDYE